MHKGASGILRERVIEYHFLTGATGFLGEEAVRARRKTSVILCGSPSGADIGCCGQASEPQRLHRAFATIPRGLGKEDGSTEVP